MRRKATHLVLSAVAAIAIAWSPAASAHCDTLDGPVVSAARKALDAGDVNLVLIWVQQRDEAELRKAFQKTVAVRKSGAEARELADQYFFETLVRIHRAGEGAPYTGLKPAGKPEPAVAAADKALESGTLEPARRLIAERSQKGLEKYFHEVTAKKKYKPGDVAAGRAYVGAYVQYVHYVERLHDAAEVPAASGGAHQPSPHSH